jgi:hypothetical protein
MGPEAGENNYFWRPTGAGHLEMSFPACGSVQICTRISSKPGAGGRRDPYLPDVRTSPEPVFTPVRPAWMKAGLSLELPSTA